MASEDNKFSITYNDYVLVHLYTQSQLLLSFTFTRFCDFSSVYVKIFACIWKLYKEFSKFATEILLVSSVPFPDSG